MSRGEEVRVSMAELHTKRTPEGEAHRKWLLTRANVLLGWRGEYNNEGEARAARAEQRAAVERFEVHGIEAFK